MTLNIKIEGGMVMSQDQASVALISSEHSSAVVDPVWGLDAGDVLESLVTLRAEDPPHELCFSAGKRYTVVRMRPLNYPRATAVVIDDSGCENNIDAEFLRNFKLIKA